MKDSLKNKIRMNKIWIIIGLMLILISPNTDGQTNIAGKNVENESFCISQEEMIMYNLINDLRRQNKLPVIPLSKSLSIVSKVHIDDLLTSKPQEQECGLHSWSNKGNWKSCCYNKDPMGSKCMNSKPFEITGYPGLGFELVYWEEETATANEAYDLWKQVDASSDMILNKGKWQLRVWKAMGVGMKNGFAIIWLGDKPDSPDNISICGRDTLIQVRKSLSPITESRTNIKNPKEVKPDTGKPLIKKEELKNAGENKTSATQLQKVTTAIPTENHYFIIVASLKTEKLAMEKIVELNNKGYADVILLPSVDRYRVSLGSYPNERLTKEKMKELKSAFPDCWLFRQ